jgi:hypothetical protein
MVFLLPPLKREKREREGKRERRRRGIYIFFSQSA